MADKEKKYYYMRLKEDYFKDDKIQILESMKDGYLYSNILLKLYLISLHSDGKLMFTDVIPYNLEAIATVTHHQVGTVKQCLDILQKLDLIEILDDGTIYMLNIQNFIGLSSTEADRKREYRNRINEHKLKIGQMSDKCLPENRDKSIEIKDNILYPPIIPPEDDCTDDATAKGVVRDDSEETAKKKSKLDHAYDPLFEEWWKAYPPRRRGSKQKCREKYESAIKNNKGLTPEKMLEALEAQKRSRDWQKQNGEYVPAPLTWLNNGRWEDEVYDPATDNANSNQNVYEMTDEIKELNI